MPVKYIYVNFCAENKFVVCVFCIKMEDDRGGRKEHEKEKIVRMGKITH
jgi:hypothetical protein